MNLFLFQFQQSSDDDVGEEDNEEDDEEEVDDEEEELGGVGDNHSDASSRGSLDTIYFHERTWRICEIPVST